MGRSVRATGPSDRVTPVRDLICAIDKWLFTIRARSERGEVDVSRALSRTGADGPGSACGGSAASRGAGDVGPQIS